MKHIKIGKKEYILVEKEEFREHLYELGWRMDVCQRETDELKTIIGNRAWAETKRQHIFEMLSQCREVLEKAYKEF